MRNPLQINDWEINRFLALTITAHVSIMAVTGLYLSGFDIPAIRESVGFIYLTFIPGFIILRLLKIHRLSLVENILYAVGLSIIFLMMVGFIVNAVYPAFGLLYPLATPPLITTTVAILAVLTIVSYYRDRDFAEPSCLKASNILSPPALFLLLLPLLSVIGVLFVNYYQSNIILMILIALVALTAVLVAFGRFIPEELYPLAAFSVALSLFYHLSLISPYLTGTDIKVEYYTYQLTNLNLYWDTTIPYQSNSVLSCTILPMMYSSMAGIEGAWVFKAIYPFLFALAMLGLYHVYREQSDKKIAFLALFFLVSLSGIYTQILSIAKQEIAVFFLVLMVILIIARRLNTASNRFLFILFALGLVTSHYGTSYLFIIFLLVAFVATSFIPWLKGRSVAFTFGSILLFVVLALSWYMYAVHLSTFEALVNTGGHIYSNLASLFNPAEYEVMAVVPMETSLPIRQVARVIYAIMPIFIGVGVLKLLIMLARRRPVSFCSEYISFSLLSFIIVATSVLVPWTTGMNFGRWYFLMTLFLAPFAIIGGIIIIGGLAKLFRLSSSYAVNMVKLIGSFILISYFLFNIGFIYELANEDPNSISLSQEKIAQYGNETRLGSFYSTIIPEQEVYSTRWLSQYGDSQVKIYADIIRRGQVLPAYGLLHEEDSFKYSLSDEYQPGDDYVYLGYLNVRYGLAPEVLLAGNMWHISEIYPSLSSKNKIYTNGGSEILR